MVYMTVDNFISWETKLDLGYRDMGEAYSYGGELEARYVLGANVALVREPVYLLLLTCQIALLAAGTTGFVLQDRQRKLGVFGKPYYFLLTNVASLIATLRYLKGDRMVTWKPLR